MPNKPLANLDLHIQTSPNKKNRMHFSAYSWKLPACSGAFLLTVESFSFVAYSWMELFCLQF